MKPTHGNGSSPCFSVDLHPSTGLVMIAGRSRHHPDD